MKIQKEIEFILAVDALKNVQRRILMPMIQEGKTRQNIHGRLLFWRKFYILMLKTEQMLIC